MPNVNNILSSLATTFNLIFKTKLSEVRPRVAMAALETYAMRFLPAMGYLVTNIFI